MDGFTCHVSTTCSAWHDSSYHPHSCMHKRHVPGLAARSRNVLNSCNASRPGGRLGQPLGRQKLLPSQLHRASPRQRRVRARSRAVYAAAASIKDPYKVLEVETSATDQLIKKAFKQKAKKLHPDVNKAVSSSACGHLVSTWHELWRCIWLGCSQMPQTGSWNARWLTNC